MCILLQTQNDVSTHILGFKYKVIKWQEEEGKPYSGCQPTKQEVEYGNDQEKEDCKEEGDQEESGQEEGGEEESHQEESHQEEGRQEEEVVQAIQALKKPSEEEGPGTYFGTLFFLITIVL